MSKLVMTLQQRVFAENIKLQFRDDGLVLFDPRTGELKNLPIYDEGSEMFKLVSYRESLVLVNGWRNVLEQQYT